METQAPAPSGTQYEIRSGNARAVAVEVGGALREYTVDGQDVLDGYPADEMCTGARGQLLVPWPNRIGDGSYTFDGEQLQLPLTEPDNHAAIHGLARWVSFSCAEHREDAVTLVHRIHPQAGWPFQLDVEVSYRIGPRGLDVRTVATNPGSRACPYGTGAHPYLSPRTGNVDDATVTAPASRYFTVDVHQLPTGCEPVDGTEFDVRSPRPLAGVRLDVAYTDLHRDADGRARVRFEFPGGCCSLWLGAAYRYLMLFTGDTLPERAKRRTGLGVEPMTCPPNAYRTGEALVRLEPGQRHEAEWGIEVG